MSIILIRKTHSITENDGPNTGEKIDILQN